MAYSFNFLTGRGGPAPIGQMSVMKDSMYDTKRFMNDGVPYEGFEISTEKLNKDSKWMKEIRENNGILPHLHIIGERKETNDTALFEVVTRHCTKTTKKMNISRMNINMPSEKLKVFPELKELSFDTCTVENASFLLFNEWCPNVNKITFEGLKLGLTAYNAFTASEDTFPNVEHLTFSFKSSVKFTRAFMKTLSQKFPNVKELDIIMPPQDDVSNSRSEYRKPYEPLHFRNVVKLFVRAFAGEIDKLFDYMAISAENLKNFSFAGMAVTEELIDWIKRCDKLDELTIDWQYRAADAGCSINHLKGMPLLTKVTLMVKYLDWSSNGIIQFARDNPSLRLLDIQGEQMYKKINFGKKYQDLFADLVKERNKITIKVLVYQDNREVKISENGFKDGKREVESEDDDGALDPNDFAMRIQEMMMRMNRNLF